MNIALINKWDVTGGAARAAYRLYSGLQQAGHDVSYCVNNKKQTQSDIVELFDISPYERFLEHLVQEQYINENRTDLSNTAFTFSLAGMNFTDYEAVANADIINLHWVEKFVAAKGLASLVATAKPLVWTLHDERPFTGGCHYSAGCKNYEEECFPCVQLKKDPFGLPRQVLLEAEEIIGAANLTIVTPSKWLGEKARKSRLFCTKRVEVIPNSIETDIFQPFSKIDAKKALGIEPTSVALMFGAEMHEEKRKGFSLLIQAMQTCLMDEHFQSMCRDGKVVVLSVGSPDSEVEELPIPLHNFGYVNDDEMMAKIYNAADMFILPSLEDNLPNTMLESMACSTPVIGFRTGGIPDFVIDEKSGLLAETGNTNELAEAILRLVVDEELRVRSGRECRRIIEKSCKREHQAKAYSKLFSELIDRNYHPGESLKKYLRNSASRYDSVFGAALRTSLEKSKESPLDEIGCPVCSSDPSRQSRYRDYINLKCSVANLCQIKTTRSPVQKYEAYKNMLLAYRKIK